MILRYLIRTIKKKKKNQKPMKEECFLTEEMIGPVGIPATDTNQIISIMGKLFKLSRIELLDILRKQSQVLKAEQLHTSTSEFKDK